MHYKVFIFVWLSSLVMFAGDYTVCEVERFDSNKAKESIEAILLIEPTNIKCILQLANIYLKQGRIARGFELLVDAYSIDPHNVQKSAIATVLPFALKVTNLRKQASATNDTESWNKLGDGYYEMGIFNEAAQMYRKSIKVDAMQDEIRLKLAISLQKNCQTYSALDELKTIISHKPSHIYANYYLGKILAHDVKNTDEARRYFKHAKEALMAKKDEISYLEYTNLLSDISKELSE